MAIVFAVDYFQGKQGEISPQSTHESFLAGILGLNNPHYIYEDGAVHVGGDGEPIELINNPDAVDPTYDELIEFITLDTTNRNDYIKGGPEGYVCADFAEAVHNNAEAAGIRAAWVSLDIVGSDDGHALNAFETTDRGQVFIDCTGKLRKIWNGYGLTGGEWNGDYYSVSDPAYLEQLDGEPVSDSVALTAWDTVAYINIGGEYGRIGINEAAYLDYDFYLEYKQKWQDYEVMLEEYNREVGLFNREISGKIYTIGSPEAVRVEVWEMQIKEQEEVLDRLGDELGYYFYELPGTSDSVAIVEDMRIYWGDN